MNDFKTVENLLFDLVSENYLLMVKDEEGNKCAKEVEKITLDREKGLVTFESEFNEDEANFTWEYTYVIDKNIRKTICSKDRYAGTKLEGGKWVLQYTTSLIELVKKYNELENANA